mgnify:CR=1 FL=1
MDNIVGPKLRVLRARLGLSQRALARKAGIPSSTVSLIESGKSSPLGEFFSQDSDPRPRVFFRSDELMEIAQGEVSYRQLGQGQPSSLQILHETYQPGADSGRVPLSHKGEEGGLLISGRLEVTVGDQIRVLKAGDGYLFSSLLPHRFRNPGREPCVVVSACTPPSF